MPLYIGGARSKHKLNPHHLAQNFVAMKQCCEYIRGLSYKLRMMRIPVEAPTCIYGDNQSVPANTTITDSSSKKMSQSIAYHFVHEGAARDEWGTSHVNTHENEADL